MANSKDAGTATAKPKQVRNLGPRYLHLAYKVDDTGNPADVTVVTNMEALVEALGAGKKYMKVQLPQRKPREAKTA